MNDEAMFIIFYGLSFASVFGVIGFLVYLEIKHGANN